MSAFKFAQFHGPTIMVSIAAICSVFGIKPDDVRRSIERQYSLYDSKTGAKLRNLRGGLWAVCPYAYDGRDGRDLYNALRAAS